MIRCSFNHGGQRPLNSLKPLKHPWFFSCPWKFPWNPWKIKIILGTLEVQDLYPWNPWNFKFSGHFQPYYLLEIQNFPTAWDTKISELNEKTYFWNPSDSRGYSTFILKGFNLHGLWPIKCHWNHMRSAGVGDGKGGCKINTSSDLCAFSANLNHWISKIFSVGPSYNGPSFITTITKASTGETLEVLFKIKGTDWKDWFVRKITRFSWLS